MSLIDLELELRTGFNYQVQVHLREHAEWKSKKLETGHASFLNRKIPPVSIFSMYISMH